MKIFLIILTAFVLVSCDWTWKNSKLTVVGENNSSSESHKLDSVSLYHLQKPWGFNKLPVGIENKEATDKSD